MYSTIVVGAHKSEAAQRSVTEAIALAVALGAHVHIRVSAYPKDAGPIDGKDTPGRADAERSMDALRPGRPARSTSRRTPFPATRPRRSSRSRRTWGPTSSWSATRG